jgi:SAM-dependent methyltransferase
VPNVFTMHQIGKLAYHKFISAFLKGDKVRCNICGNTFKKFLRHGKNRRNNSRCPICHSTEATRTLWFYLSNEVIGKKNKTNFLYFNPDPSLLNKLNALPLNLTLKSKEYFLFQDEKIRGGSFDVILMPHLIQFLKNEDQALEELLRLLRPGGFVLMMTVINWSMDRVYESPKTEEDESRLGGTMEPGVERVYGSNFQKHIERAGFKVEAINYPEQLGEPAHQYYRLGDEIRELIFKCKK